MERSEYEERLEAFASSINAARQYAAVLETLIKEDRETLGVLTTYQGFFAPVRAALNNGLFLETAKALDTDSRTASLPNLMKAVRECPALATGVDIGTMEAWLEDRADLISDLTSLRNKRVAHFDVSTDELPGGLNYGEFQDLLEELKNHWHVLERALRGSGGIMDLMTASTRDDTEEVRQLLVEARRRHLNPERLA